MHGKIFHGGNPVEGLPGLSNAYYFFCSEVAARLFAAPDAPDVRVTGGVPGAGRSRTPAGGSRRVPVAPEWAAARQSGGGHGSPDGPLPRRTSGDSGAQRGGSAGRASVGLIK